MASIVRPLPDETSNSGGWPSWLVRLAPVVAAVMLAVALAVVFVGRGEHSEWNACFVPAARQMAHGQAIHGAESTYAYPPSMAFLSLPICLLPLPVSLGLWSLVNAVATTVVVVSAWRLIDGPSPQSFSPRWWAILALGSLLSARWVLAPLQHQQFDMVIVALLFAGCWLLVQGRDGWGGALIGLAASMKCTPLLFIPYLIWRGRGRAAAMVFAVAAGINFLPDLCFPKQAGGLYLTDWWQTWLSRSLAGTPGTWDSILLNQSLGSLFNRGTRGFPWTAELLEVSELPVAAIPWLRGLTYGVGLTLIGLTMVFAGRPFRPLPDRKQARRGTTTPSAWHWSVEFAAVGCLMLLVSPMSHKTHYALLALPALILARLTFERPSRWRLILLAVLLICGPLTTKGIVGKVIAECVLIWGLPTVSVVAILAALWHEMLVGRRQNHLGPLAQHGEEPGADSHATARGDGSARMQATTLRPIPNL